MSVLTSHYWYLYTTYRYEHIERFLQKVCIHIHYTCTEQTFTLTTEEYTREGCGTHHHKSVLKPLDALWYLIISKHLYVYIMTLS